MKAQKANGQVATSHRGLLPASYSPELNPDERLNAVLKQAIGTKVSVRTKARLRAAANDHMQFIAANRDRVRSYF